MITKNKHTDQDCRKLLAAFFSKFPNNPLQAAADCVLTRLLAGDISLPGKPAGWVAGIIYAVANQGRRPCGIPGVLNQECEDFFHISIGTVYRRAAKIRLLLAG